MARKRLNIAMLSLHSCPLGELGSRDTGGMSVYIREVASEIGKRGHSVDIYTRAHDPQDKQVYHLDENVRLIHLQVGQVERMHKLILYTYLGDASCSVENFRKSLDIQYDLIHSHYWLSVWVGRRIQTWWKVPHVTMFHTLGAVKNAIGIGEEEPELRVVTENELIEDSHCIIASTESEMRDIVSYYGASQDKIKIIPCGVNLSTFHNIDQSSARQNLGLNGNSIILFVGRIEPLKGVDRLLEAISKLDKKKIELIVIGGDTESQSELDRLHNISQELNIQDLVTFTGNLEHEELPQYYSAADICVIPSYYESFGLVALESLACGTPVVSTRVGGIEKIVQQGKTGYIVDSNSAPELAKGIAKILSNKSSGSPRANTEFIRDSISQFNWGYVAEALIEQYETMLDKG